MNLKASVLLLWWLVLLQFAQTTIAALISQSGRATESRTHYTAGVVEFRQSTFEDNLAAYLEIINSTAAAATDIIVFPEGTLSSNDDATFVPDPTVELIVPCLVGTQEQGYHKVLVELSCAARQARKYIVVNVAEKVYCPDDPADKRPCAPNGLNMYNTNVVFNRDGRVVSRYRKINLYGEPKNVTWTPQIGWFDTDFGVRFGHFVCFDILFYTPSQILIDQWEIRDFIFPTMWFSQIPFLTAVQFHLSWSYGNDVNLLAAGASKPEVGSTGSGIYAGRNGPLVTVMNENPGERRLYVAEVPIRTSTKSMRTFEQSKVLPPPMKDISDTPIEHIQQIADIEVTKPFNIRLKRDYLELYESVPLDLTQGNQLTSDVCYDSDNTTFCCHFELRWRTLNTTEKVAGSTYYKYRVGVYNGWRREEGAAENFLKNCALFTCLSDGDTDDIMQCGKFHDANTSLLLQPQLEFEHLLIEATFPHRQQYLLMPNSLLDNLLPLSVKDFLWDDVLNGSNHTVRYQLNTTVRNLLTFSIYGNYFDNVQDPDTNDNSGKDAATITMPAMKLALLVACSVLLLFSRFNGQH